MALLAVLLSWLVCCSGVFAAEMEGAANNFRWSSAAQLTEWKADNFASHGVEANVFKGVTQYDAQLFSPTLKADAGRWGALEFRLKSSVGGGGQVFFRQHDNRFSHLRQVNFSIAATDKYQTYRIDLKKHPEWKGIIEQIRFDPIDTAGTQLEIEYIRLVPVGTGGLVPNGGFELYDETKGFPESWSARQLQVGRATGNGTGVQLKAGALPGELQSARFEFFQTGRYELAARLKRAATAAKLQARLSFYSGLEQKIEEVVLDLPVANTGVWEEPRALFEVPERAAYGVLTVVLPPQSTVEFDLLAVNPKLKTQQERYPWQEQWRGSWIIAADSETQPAAARYFRSSFDIGDVNAVSVAKIEVTADDTVQVFVNGTELKAGPNWRNWQLPDIYDIKPHLQPGRNTIGFLTKNYGGVEGLLAEAGILGRDDARLITTDGSWKTFVGVADTGWAKSTFDDSAWKPARELGKYPLPSWIAPWGAIPYTYIGKKNVLTYANFTAPARASLGEDIAVSLDVTPQTRLALPMALQLKLEPAPGNAKGLKYDFPLIALDTANWQAGKKSRLEYSVPLPAYVPAGEYRLSAGLTHSQNSDGTSTVQQDIHLSEPAQRKSPVTRVVYLPGNVPAFEINGETIPVMHLMTDATKNNHDVVLANGKKNNVNLIWVNVPQGFTWEKDRQASFDSLDSDMARLLSFNPQAYVVLNVPLDPVYNPGMRKWNDLHPDELIRNEQGSDDVSAYNNAVVKAPSYASSIWQRDAQKSWRELINHVQNSVYRDRVIGYVPISGISWEWFSWGSQNQEFLDYSQPFRVAFAAWLQREYKNDIGLLNRAWKTSYTGFADVQVPGKNERMAVGDGMLLDPAVSGRVIDLHEFFTQLISDNILRFCEIVKHETSGKAICGTYYGYVMYIGRPYFGVHSGHYALGKMLASPDIDFFMSPSRYADRGIGGGSGFMTANDSIKLHNKLTIVQADIRTFRASGPAGQLARLDTIHDSVETLKQEFANTVVNGAAVQWYDFGHGWIIGDTRLMEAVGKMQQIERELQQTPRETMDKKASVAVIVNEKSILYSKVDSFLQDAAVNRQIDELNRSGMAWDTYLLSDLHRIEGYRCYIFLNSFEMSRADREYVDRHLKKEGNTLVWIGPAGIIKRQDGQPYADATYNPQFMSELTGFNLKAITSGPLTTKIVAGEQPLTKGLPNGLSFGEAAVTGARFAAQDGNVLGTFADAAQPSLSVKSQSGWTSIYSASPTLPAALLRNIAATAGIPLVNKQEGDVTYVSQNLFAVHSLPGGEREFNIGNQYARAKELFTGQEIAVTQGKFSYSIPERSTVLFLLQKQ